MVPSIPWIPDLCRHPGAPESKKMAYLVDAVGTQATRARPTDVEDLLETIVTRSGQQRSNSVCRDMELRYSVPC